MGETFKKDLELLLLDHKDELLSKTPDFILADFIVACLAALESELQKEAPTDTTEYIGKCLSAYQAAALARWRWHHTAVGFGFPKKLSVTVNPGAHEEGKK